MPGAPLPHLLAHQGGWDEALLVAGPIIVLAVVLVMANRRATRLQEGQNGAADAGEAADGDSPDDEGPAGSGSAGEAPPGDPVERRDDAGAADTVPGDER